MQTLSLTNMYEQSRSNLIFCLGMEQIIIDPLMPVARPDLISDLQRSRTVSCTQQRNGIERGAFKRDIQARGKILRKP
jgi:hypothetical protein